MKELSPEAIAAGDNVVRLLDRGDYPGAFRAFHEIPPEIQKEIVECFAELLTTAASLIAATGALVLKEFYKAGFTFPFWSPTESR